MVDIATVFVDWLDAGLFAQLTQCGRIDVFPVIDESCRQTVGEGVAADTVFSFDQVQILRAVMHQHDHTGRVPHHLSADHGLSAVSCLQRDTHVLHAENRALIHVLSAEYCGRSGHVHAIAGFVQRHIHAGRIGHRRSAFLPAGRQYQIPGIGVHGNPADGGDVSGRLRYGTRHIAHGVLEPYGFDGAVWRVDEHRTNSGVASAEFDVRGTHGRLIARLLDGIGHRMMAQIAGHIHIDAVPARTSSNRESPEPGNTATVPIDCRVKVAAHLHAKFGVWQRVGHTTGEITQCDRLLQPADTAQSDRMFGFPGILHGYQRTLFDQAERVGGGQR